MAQRPLVPIDRILSGTAPTMATAAASRASSGLVEQAVAILSRQNFTPPRPLGGTTIGAPEDLRQRAVEVVTELFSILASQEGPARGRTDAVSSVPWQRAPAPMAAGSSLTILLRLENQGSDGADPRGGKPVQISLYSTDLVSNNGNTIPSYLISFVPASRTLGPKESADVQVNVAVPLQAIPGSYSGLVQAMGLSAVKAVITIEVL